MQSNTDPSLLARLATFLGRHNFRAICTLFRRIKHFTLLLLCLLTYRFMTNLCTLISVDTKLKCDLLTYFYQ